MQPLSQVVLFTLLPAILVLLGFLIVNWMFKGLPGDPYNLVGAWISAMAFAAVILSIQHQSAELELQREDLALQHTELRATLEEHKKMADAQSASEKRLFLSAYVNSLSLLRDLTATRPEVHYGKSVDDILVAATLHEMEFKLQRLTGLMDSQAQTLFKGIYLKTDDDRILDTLVSELRTINQISIETSVEVDMAILKSVDAQVSLISDFTWRNSKATKAKWKATLEAIELDFAAAANDAQRHSLKRKIFEAQDNIKHMLADFLWNHEAGPIFRGV